MKHIFTFILGILTLFAQGQVLTNIEWNSPHYAIIYSQEYEQPLLVEYSVCGINGTFSRKGMVFYTEDGIKTSDDADYFNNVWDKGHMAPAASLNCEYNMLWETFSYINCALQHEKLNRGVWKSLEERERELSRKLDQMADVFIEIDFAEVPQRVPTGAAIPLGFYKEIAVGETKECYWFKNEAPKSNRVEDYKCKCRD